jgi:hypothetical protein
MRASKPGRQAHGSQQAGAQQAGSQHTGSQQPRPNRPKALASAAVLSTKATPRHSVDSTTRVFMAKTPDTKRGRENTHSQTHSAALSLDLFGSCNSRSGAALGVLHPDPGTLATRTRAMTTASAGQSAGIYRLVSLPAQADRHILPTSRELPIWPQRV